MADPRVRNRSIGRTIGPEPAGATPIEDEDLKGLIPDFVATRADLNQVEFENIAKALPWALRKAQILGAERVLSYGFMLAVHRRMFSDVWKWAGTQRVRVTNIGVEPHLIAEASQLALTDAKFWHAEQTFCPDELAARIHCRLVTVHPFPNGNGRCTRLMADLYLASIEAEPFAWGRPDIDSDGSAREAYIAALLKAIDAGDYADLVAFARGLPAEGC